MSDIGEYRRDLLERTRAELSLADNKASILLAGTLAGAGGASAAVGSAGWSLSSQPTYSEVLFWLLVLAAAASLSFSGAAIYPRFAGLRGKAIRTGYFGDVARYASATEFSETLKSGVISPDNEWDDQIWQLSNIIIRKYTLVRRGMNALGVALMIGLVLLILGIQ